MRSPAWESYYVIISCYLDLIGCIARFYKVFFMLCYVDDDSDWPIKKAPTHPSFDNFRERPFEMPVVYLAVIHFFLVSHHRGEGGGS